jgi:hypothetical protein
MFLDKLKDYLKQPSTYVILAIGAVAVLAVPMLRRLFTPIAKAIPGSKA